MNLNEELKVYDELTGELLDGPFDYSKGEIRRGKRFVAHHEAIEKVSHKEVMPGTEHMNDGNGLYGLIIDQPAKEAWDEYEECYFWHTFTDEELSSSSKDIAQIIDSISSRVSALENYALEG